MSKIQIGSTLGTFVVPPEQNQDLEVEQDQVEIFERTFGVPPEQDQDLDQWDPNNPNPHCLP